MVIYITKEQDNHILDDLTDRLELQLIKETVTDGISLNEYISRKMPVIQDLQFLIADTDCLNDTDLLSVIHMIQTIWHVRTILLESKVLINEDGDSVRVLYPEEDIIQMNKNQESLLSNIEYILKGETIPVQNTMDEVWIGIISSHGGAGATHMAIHLTNYIHTITDNVCYVEANESGDLCSMADFYHMEKIEDNHYIRNGVDYWHQSIDQEKKYVVLDLGKFTASKMMLLNKCKIKILVSDGQPYRIMDMLNVYKRIGNDQTHLVFNYLDAATFKQLHDFYDLPEKTYRLSQHKDFFSGVDKIYDEMLKDYIRIPQKQRFSFLFSAKGINRPKQAIPNNSPEEEMPEENTYPEEEMPAENSYPEEEEMPAENSYPEEEEMPEESSYPKEEKIPAENSYPEEEKIPAENSYPEEEEMPEENSYPEEEEIPAENSYPEEEEIPEENSYPEEEEIPAESSYPEEEMPEENDYQEKGAKNRKKVVVSVMLLFVIGSFFGILKNHLVSSFPNPVVESTTETELVDDELNINPDIKLSVMEVDGADGYEVSYSTDKSFPAKKTVVVEVQTADKAVESLVADKTYYVRVRAFKYNQDGIKVYGDYTDVQKIRT